MPNSLMTSLLSPFHVYRSLILRIVLFMPRWPEVGSQWQAWRIFCFSEMSQISLTICVVSINSPINRSPPPPPPPPDFLAMGLITYCITNHPYPNTSPWAKQYQSREHPTPQLPPSTEYLPVGSPTVLCLNLIIITSSTATPIA